MEITRNGTTYVSSSERTIERGRYLWNAAGGELYFVQDVGSDGVTLQVVSGFEEGSTFKESLNMVKKHSNEAFIPVEEK